MRSIQPFFCFKRLLSQSKGGFTVLEVVVALCLLGIFATLLMSSLYQVIQFAGRISEQTRQCQELRKLCEVLTADCRNLFLSSTRDSIELDASLSDKAPCSLLLLRRFNSGWEQALISPTKENGACALVQYQFYPERQVISRLIWRLEETQVPSVIPGSKRLQDVLPQEDVLLSRKLVQNVANFKLYAIDDAGQKQTEWVHGSRGGLEYEVTFHSVHQQRRLQKFYARIPVPRMGEKERVLPYNEARTSF